MRKQKQEEAAAETELDRLQPELAEIAAALDSGKAPRGGKTLKEAAKQLKAAGRPAEASRALLLLARLERRRHGDAAAVPPARSALRLARGNKASSEIDASLDLLAYLHSNLDDHTEARRCAEERVARAHAAGDAAVEADALARLALVLWAAGQRGDAFSTLDEARRLCRNGAQEALASLDILLACFLAQSGCPTAAVDLLTRLLRSRSTQPRELDALLVRGWALLCGGRPDSAARDFRRARRAAHARQNRVAELMAAGALAVAELHRDNSGAGTRRSRAEALLDRTVRTSRRLGHPGLIQTVNQLSAALNGGAPVTPREAAQRLVVLARSTESVTAADASVREVERLARVPADQPAYHCDLRLPFTLE